MNSFSTALSAFVALVSMARSLPAQGDGAAASPKPPPKTLRTVAIPDANSVKDDQEKIAKWLETKLGIPVEFVPVQDYAAAVVALATGKAELGWLGGVTTVQAMQQSKGKVVPVVTTENNLHFKSYVIANKRLGAKKLEDLKGKTFSFGNKTSTSGHIMARWCLEQAGVDAEKFFAKVAFSGDHTKVVLDVAGGAVECGVLNYSTFDRMLAGKDATKKAAAEAVDIVWTTPEYVDYAWNVRTDLDERCGKGTRQKLEAAFLGLDPKVEADAALLKIRGGHKYVVAKPESWNGIKAVLEKIDITK